MAKVKKTKKQIYKEIEKDEEAFKKFRLNFVKKHLRHATYKWPYGHFALENNKLDGLFKCDGCGQYFPEKQVQKDHIIPVEDVKLGFTTVDNYVERLLIKTDQYQILCKDICHAQKTAIENKMRVSYGHKAKRIINRKKAKKLKK